MEKVKVLYIVLLTWIINVIINIRLINYKLQNHYPGFSAE